MNAERPTVHIVDDDASFRKSVARLLEASHYQVAVYESAVQFLDVANSAAFGCVLLDVRMPNVTGLQLQERLAELGTAFPIIFLTGHGDIPMSVRAMKSGAEDFLTKPVDLPSLLHAIEGALSRSRNSHALAQRQRELRSRFEQLSPRAREVFALVVRGRLNKQAASELGISERTIKWHRRNIMEKLGVESLAELVSIAERLGLLETSS
ncbi:MAG: response regulator transcription factor [Betaproteobacteria bacterium]